MPVEVASALERGPESVIHDLPAKYRGVLGPQTIDVTQEFPKPWTGRSPTRPTQHEGNDMTAPQNPRILFLCVHNAGRSQMAAAFAREIGGDNVIIYSAGSAPGEQLNPAVVEAMNEVGIDISNKSLEKLTDEIAKSADVIVTMGCGDECPYYSGKRYVDWELQDPAGQRIETVREIRADIEGRVRSLLGELL